MSKRARKLNALEQKLHQAVLSTPEMVRSLATTIMWVRKLTQAVFTMCLLFQCRQ